MHDFPLITTLAAAFTTAWLLGLITQRIGLSPIVGYLLAGILIGPHTPGFVGDVGLAPQLAELGVILLMFGVGLHFHLKDLLAVRSIAIPGAVGQSVIATAATVLIFHYLGLSLTAGLVMGFAMAVASTVVLMRVLMDNDQLNTPAGHAALGWLIVEDILTVIVLVLIPALAQTTSTNNTQALVGFSWLVPLAIALLKLVLLVATAMVLGARLVPWILVQVARLRSRELFTLTILVLSIAVATAAALIFGASVALGAFIAGMVVAQSPVSEQAAAEALPLRDAFAVLFFVAVGMLFEPVLILQEPLLLLAALFVVLIVKPLAALSIVLLLGYPLRTALLIALSLAQIGEFSFILAELAYKYGMLPTMGRPLLVATALISITINPLLFRSIEPIERLMQRWPWLWGYLNLRSQKRTEQSNSAAIQNIRENNQPFAIVIGYGPVGQQIDRLLREAGKQTVIIDLNMDVVSMLSAEGRLAIFGDATRAEVLAQAGVCKASHVILTTSKGGDRQNLVSATKQQNPDTKLLIRTRYLRDQVELMQLGADSAVVDEVESAVALSKLVLAEAGIDPQNMRDEIQRVRQALSRHYHPSHA